MSDRTPAKRDETLQTALASRGRRNSPFAGKKVHKASNVGLLAMQKVVGSSPISRFPIVPPSKGFLRSPARSRYRAVGRFLHLGVTFPGHHVSLAAGFAFGVALGAEEDRDVGDPHPTAPGYQAPQAGSTGYQPERSVRGSCSPFCSLWSCCSSCWEAASASAVADNEASSRPPPVPSLPGREVPSPRRLSWRPGTEDCICEAALIARKRSAPQPGVEGCRLHAGAGALTARPGQRRLARLARAPRLSSAR